MAAMAGHLPTINTLKNSLKIGSWRTCCCTKRPTQPKSSNIKNKMRRPACSKKANRRRLSHASTWKTTNLHAVESMRTKMNHCRNSKSNLRKSTSGIWAETNKKCLGTDSLMASWNSSCLGEEGFRWSGWPNIKRTRRGLPSNRLLQRVPIRRISRRYGLALTSSSSGALLKKNFAITQASWTWSNSITISSTKKTPG